MSYTPNLEVLARGLARKIGQYKDSPNLDGLLSAFLEQVQTLENNIAAVNASRDVDKATGLSLDAIGALVGRPRAGLADDLYRVFIKGQTLVNRSRGTAEDIIAAVLAVVSNSGKRAYLVERTTSRSFELRVIGPVTAYEAQVLPGIVKRARAAGVRATTLMEPAGTTGPYLTLSPTALITTSTTQGLGDSSDPAVGGQLITVYDS